VCANKACFVGFECNAHNITPVYNVTDYKSQYSIG